MKYHELPWFVREDIIKLVIDKEPKYCRVSKNWLKLVAATHGLLIISSDPPKYDDLSTLFTPYIEKVQFFRTTNINWDFVYSHKNIADVLIQIKLQEERTKNSCGELFSKCIWLPRLRRLTIMLSGIPNFDQSCLIRENQFHLNQLIISSVVNFWELPISKMTLLNLVYLDIIDVPSTSIQIITIGMPNLKSLCVKFIRLEESILFNDFEMVNLTKLDLTASLDYSVIKVNLFHLPNLRILILRGHFIIGGEHIYNNVQELQIDHTTWFFTNPILSKVSNLMILNLTTLGYTSNKKLGQLLQQLTTLTKAHLTIKCKRDLKNLPVGPYRINDLTLDGKFSTTPYLLHWLSSSFRLKALDLHGCHLKSSVWKEIPEFNHLLKLKLRVNTRHVKLLSKNFNKKTHPHIDPIEIICCNCTEC